MQTAIPLTILTLPNEFPLIFLFRLVLSGVILFSLIKLSKILYVKNHIDKIQRNYLIALSIYVVIMLYYTVLGRYFKSNFMYDSELFSTMKILVSRFDISTFIQLIINLVMMIPVSYMMMNIFTGKLKALWTVDISILLVLFIETLQFVTKSGTFQFDDIINNSIGVLLGIVVYYIFRFISKKKRDKNYD